MSTPGTPPSVGSRIKFATFAARDAATPWKNYRQTHIEYEACEKHGMYLDAGEFTDYKHETLMDIFRDFIFMLKKA